MRHVYCNAAILYTYPMVKCMNCMHNVLPLATELSVDVLIY